VPAGLRAYRCLSFEPKYIVPSFPMAGEEAMSLSVLYFHLRLPSGLRAYKNVSKEPK